MNCETIPPMLNAALDDELSAADRAAVEAHLSECDSCREQWIDLQSLDETLKFALKPPSAEPVIDRVLEILSNNLNGSNRASLMDGAVAVGRPMPSGHGDRIPTLSASSRRPAAGTMLLLVCTLLVAMGVLIQFPGATPAVAEITMATGSIDIMRANAHEWTAVDGSSRVPLPAHARVRTGPASLCEIRTKSEALVRVNHQTELVLHRSEQIELVAGEFWCRAPATSGLEISCERTPRQPARVAVFTCPSSSETQWQAAPDQELRCLAVSSLPVELKVNLPPASCIVQPGESLTFGAGNVPSDAGSSDRLRATNWQLPLLVLRSPEDRELRQRLTQLLATVGQSKMRNLPEDQIRQLGPAGTLPLLAFVRSIEAYGQPQLRYRAMEIIADLAPQGSLGELEALLKDDDPIVRRLSLQALHRLQPDRKFENR